MIVENKLTPLTREQAASALAEAYQRLTGARPTAAVLALLLAQSALETGNWQKIHNFNFGNAKAGADYPLIVQFHCSEVDEHGVEHFFDPPDPHCNFRAYSDAASGALDYLKVLHSRPTWWQGLHTGDPSRFVDALATPPKYFTANPGPYKRTVTTLFEAFRPLAVATLPAPASQRHPTPDQLKDTLAATFSKWFAGTPFDPVLTSKGTTRSATADLIQLERVSRERLSFPLSARRREELPGMFPTVRPGDIVWIEVSFAYRGQVADMPWPVRTGAAVQLQSSANCPVDADWILDSAAVPTVDAPPEKSSTDKAGDAITDTAQNVGGGLVKVLWIPLAIVGVGVLLYVFAFRAASSSAPQAEAA